ncbi:ABC transporter permease [Marinoscillum pacificum]|uniref:ABC transporter permease n=1 Tax=Marinoscillum pacificum TaxID=392723 RepID=UPI002157B464|nr:FtsX-like permease family protein [Marinoscillum pacificum]
MNNPPKIALKFFRWFCRKDLLKYIEGDLIELFEEQVETKGLNKARLLFTWEVLKLFRPDIIRLNRSITQINQWTMFKNYLKVGIRNLLRYKAFSFINIFGLAVAMVVTLLLILLLVDQHQYDQFHTHSDRIYRIHSKLDNSIIANASSPVPLVETMQNDFAIIESGTNLIPGVGGDVIFNSATNTEIRGFFADDQFFKVFSFQLKEGNERTALAQPNSMVITSEVAQKLFHDDPAVGQQVRFLDRGLGLMKIDIGTGKEEVAEDWGTFTITGVVNLNDYKSHIDFDMLVSASTLPRLYQEGKVQDRSESWENYSVGYSYLMVYPDVSEAQLLASLQELVDLKYKDIADLSGIEFLPRSLNQITPGAFVGNPITLRLPIEAYFVLFGLAIVILLSAGFNYTNLSIARALTRTREIGVRKVNGAHRGSLIFQFLTESVLTSFCASTMAVVMLLLLKPVLNALWINQVLNFDLTINGWVFVGFFGVSLMVGLLAGAYPALVLSRFTPLKALKNLTDSHSSRFGFKRILNIAQFAFSLLFIVTAILIARQFHHIVNFEYGFSTENIINIPIQGNDYKLIQREFESIAGVSDISACEFVPALLHTNGASVSRAFSSEDLFNAEMISVSPDFIKTMSFELVAGKNLPAHLENSVVVNMSCIDKLKWDNPNEALGQTIYLEGQKAVQIAGVINDVKFQNPIMGDGKLPLILVNKPELFSFVNVKVNGDPYEVVHQLEEKWAAIDQTHPFNYFIYQDQLAKSTRWFGDLVSIVIGIAALAVIISCLGLLGMAIYTTERRIKEVSIRKVLGANTSQLLLALGRSFLILLLIAIVIGGPLSYLISNLWLESFPNRVDFGLGTVAIGSLCLLLIGSITIITQIVTVSRTNPVKSLKDE